MAIDLTGFARSLTYTSTATPAELLADIGRLRDFDAVHEKIESKWAAIAWTSVFATVLLGIIAVVISSDGNSTVGTPLLVVAIGLLIWTVVAFTKKSSYGRMNVENRRYELVARTLPMLEADMAPGVPVALHLDLAPNDAQTKFKGEGKAGHWDVKFFEDPWLRIQGRYVDGTRFTISFEERHQKRSRYSRSRSGKIKRKTKEKTKFSAAVHLRVKPSKYPTLKLLADGAQTAVQLPPCAALRSLQISEQQLLLKTGISELWSASGPDAEENQDTSGPRIIASMLMSCYQVLNLSRNIHKGQSAASGGAS